MGARVHSLLFPTKSMTLQQQTIHTQKLNVLLPDLVTAGFDLVRSVIRAGGLDEVARLVGTTKRAPSSHCAIS